MASTAPLGKSRVLATTIVVTLVLGACGGISAPGPGRGHQDPAPAAETRPKGAAATASSRPAFRSRALTATPDARPEEGVITGVDRTGFDLHTILEHGRTWI